MTKPRSLVWCSIMILISKVKIKVFEEKIENQAYFRLWIR